MIFFKAIIYSSGSYLMHLSIRVQKSQINLLFRFPDNYITPMHWKGYDGYLLTSTHGDKNTRCDGVQAIFPRQPRQVEEPFALSIIGSHISSLGLAHGRLFQGAINKKNRTKLCDGNNRLSDVYGYHWVKQRADKQSQDRAQS